MTNTLIADLSAQTVAFDARITSTAIDWNLATLPGVFGRAQTIAEVVQTDAVVLALEHGAARELRLACQSGELLVAFAHVSEICVDAAAAVHAWVVLAVVYCCRRRCCRCSCGGFSSSSSCCCCCCCSCRC